MSGIGPPFGLRLSSEALKGRVKLRAPKPTQYVRGHDRDAGSGRNASESLFGAWFTMSETVPADHNCDQACDLRNGSGEKGLKVVKPLSKGEPHWAWAAIGRRKEGHKRS